MSLNLNFPSSEGRPPIPDPLIHKANDEAVRASDATNSWEASNREIRQEISHPTHQKLVEALQSRRIWLFGFLSLVFIAVLFWEWEISREIYEVRFPVWPLIPFSVLAGLSLLAGACLGEGTPLFSLFSAEGEEPTDKGDSVIRVLYDRPRQKLTLNNRAVCMTLGILVGLIVVVAIWIISQERVELLKAAGELNAVASTSDIYLPVVLYGVEIMLGIPTFYFAIWLYDLRRVRKLRKQLTLQRDLALTLRASAIQNYTTYMSALDEYNSWRTENGKPKWVLIPVNLHLKRLLVKEFGYDPTETDGLPRPENGASGEQHGDPPPDDGAGDGQVDDLINVLDQEIADKNRSL